MRNADPAQVLVLGLGCFLVVVSLAVLRGPAEWVALICAVVFCFGWNARGIGAITKLLSCAIAIIIVLILNAGQPKRDSEQKAADKRDQETKLANITTKRLNEEMEEKEAFSRLTPEQHLQRANAGLKVGADEFQLAAANADLDALKSTRLSNEAVKLRTHYRLEAEKARKAYEANQAIVGRVLRGVMAKSTENAMLDKGYNVDVTAVGANGTTLRFKWIGVSKVFAHEMSKNSDLFDSARKAGFKKIVATDGYDEVWTWTL